MYIYGECWSALFHGIQTRASQQGFATFEFDREFLEKGLDLSPIKMPIIDARRGTARFEFRTLSKETYRGLPGMLADALPDRFGNRIIDAWLARQGRTTESFSSVERLCYTGKRAMGALEFSPIINQVIERSVRLSGRSALK